MAAFIFLTDTSLSRLGWEKADLNTQTHQCNLFFSLLILRMSFGPASLSVQIIIEFFSGMLPDTALPQTAVDKITLL